MGTRANDKWVNSHGLAQTKKTSWLVHGWSTFGARTNHGHTWTHKIHHSLNLGQATTFLLIVFSMPSHESCTQISFCLGIPKSGVLKFPELGLLWLWKPKTFCADLWLNWGLKQSCSPCQKLFNDMLHAIYK
jgi:hypothetical protein